VNVGRTPFSQVMDLCPGEVLPGLSRVTVGMFASASSMAFAQLTYREILHAYG